MGFMLATSVAERMLQCNEVDPIIKTTKSRLGLSDDCYRVSIGLEEPGDLIEDLAQVLAGYEGGAHFRKCAPPEFLLK